MTTIAVSATRRARRSRMSKPLCRPRLMSTKATSNSPALRLCSASSALDHRHDVVAVLGREPPRSACGRPPRRRRRGCCHAAQPRLDPPERSVTPIRPLPRSAPRRSRGFVPLLRFAVQRAGSRESARRRHRVVSSNAVLRARSRYCVRSRGQARGHRSSAEKNGVNICDARLFVEAGAVVDDVDDDVANPLGRGLDVESVLHARADCMCPWPTGQPAWRSSTMFKNSCWSWSSLPRTSGRLGSNAVAISHAARFGFGAARAKSRRSARDGC